MSYVLKDVYDLINDAKELYQRCLEERKQIKGFIKYLRNMN